VEPVHDAPVEARLIVRQGDTPEKSEDERGGGQSKDGDTARSALPSNRDRSDEPVSAARQRLEIFGRGRGIRERHPNAPDAEIEAAIEVDVDGAAPESLPELIPRHELAGTPRQELEHPRRLVLELDPGSAPK
jgi:hypothetical protein